MPVVLASNTGMTAPLTLPTSDGDARADERLADVEQRLTDLEIKLSFSEDLVDHLNEIVSQQQQQLDALLREVRQLQAQRPDDGGQTFRSLRDEMPPHY